MDAQAAQLKQQSVILEETLAQNKVLEDSQNKSPIWYSVFFIAGVALGAIVVGNASK